MSTTHLLFIIGTLVAVSSADFVQLLHGPLANPQYTLTFDDIPAQYLPVWNYYWYHSSSTVGIGQAFGAIVNDSANYWNSDVSWFDQPYKPGNFHTLYGDYLDYNFNPPIKMFSAKIRATTNNVARISVKLVNGTEISLVSIFPVSFTDINRYDYYGFNSSVAITNVFIRGGAVNVDDVQYNTICPTGSYLYNSTTDHCIDVDECATGDYVCDPNAFCVNTVGSYTCQCGTDYQGDGKTCTLQLTAIDYPLANPQETITFNDLPLGTLPPGSYLWLDNATRVGIFQTESMIIDSKADYPLQNYWNGSAPWYDQPTKTPGHYFGMIGDVAIFVFDPPIKSFSAKMIATSGNPFLEVVLVSYDFFEGPDINFSLDLPPASIPIGSNQYKYYGFETNSPIRRVTLSRGTVNIDDFQFITVCQDKTANYDYGTKTCT